MNSLGVKKKKKEDRNLKKYLIVFFISMVPLIELRGAIPYAVGFQLPLLPSYIVAIIGNMLPVPFIYLFARKVLEIGSSCNVTFFRKFCCWCMEKGERGGEKLKAKAGRGLFVALLLFVGIPLPGTGAWTGALIASLLGIDIKKSSMAILCGIGMATVIMYFVSYVLVGNIVS